MEVDFFLAAMWGCCWWVIWKVISCLRSLKVSPRFFVECWVHSWPGCRWVAYNRLDYLQAISVFDITVLYPPADCISSNGPRILQRRLWIRHLTGTWMEIPQFRVCLNLSAFHPLLWDRDRLKRSVRQTRERDPDFCILCSCIHATRVSHAQQRYIQTRYVTMDYLHPKRHWPSAGYMYWTTNPFYIMLASLYRMALFKEYRADLVKDGTAKSVSDREFCSNKALQGFSPQLIRCSIQAKFWQIGNRQTLRKYFIRRDAPGLVLANLWHVDRLSFGMFRTNSIPHHARHSWLSRVFIWFTSPTHYPILRYLPWCFSILYHIHSSEVYGYWKSHLSISSVRYTVYLG